MCSERLERSQIILFIYESNSFNSHSSNSPLLEHFESRGVKQEKNRSTEGVFDGRGVIGDCVEEATDNARKQAIVEGE